MLFVRDERLPDSACGHMRSGLDPDVDAVIRSSIGTVEEVLMKRSGRYGNLDSDKSVGATSVVRGVQRSKKSEGGPLEANEEGKYIALRVKSQERARTLKSNLIKEWWPDKRTQWQDMVDSRVEVAIGAIMAIMNGPYVEVVRRNANGHLE